jgi:zinc protease
MTFDETLAEIAALKLDDVRAFYRQFYGASNGRHAVDDFDPAGSAPRCKRSSATGPADRLRARAAAGVRRPAGRLRIEVKDKRTPSSAAGCRCRCARTSANTRRASCGADLRQLGRRQQPPLGSSREKEGLSYGVGGSLSEGSSTATPTGPVRHRRAAERRRRSRRVRRRDRALAATSLPPARARRAIAASSRWRGQDASLASALDSFVERPRPVFRRARRAAGTDHTRRSQRRVASTSFPEDGVRRRRRFQQPAPPPTTQAAGIAAPAPR